MQKRIFRYGASAMAALLAAVVFAAVPGPARAQSPRLDHFKCYVVLDFEPFTTTVELRDQFDDVLGLVEKVNVLDPLRFCNPAEKDFAGVISPIVNINNHLTFYQYERVENQPIKGRVGVSNQFGQQALTIESADILALPTEKQEPGLEPPDRLDHFKCYFATATPLDSVIVELKDQFATSRHKVLETRLFCNPVVKTDAAGQTTEIVNPEDHLVCYRISLGNAKTRSLVIANQFTSPTTDLAVGRDNLLCVPSEKLIFDVF